MAEFNRLASRIISREPLVNYDEGFIVAFECAEILPGRISEWLVNSNHR